MYLYIRWLPARFGLVYSSCLSQFKIWNTAFEINDDFIQKFYIQMSNKFV